MTRYVSTPVEVDAFQFKSFSPNEDIMLALKSSRNVVQGSIERHDYAIHFRTENGLHLSLMDGDWLVVRPNQSVSTLPDDWFRMKYTRILS